MADADTQIVYTSNILWLDGADAEMSIAVREAQRTFDEYRQALGQPSMVGDSGVKVFFPSSQNPAAGEHMWVNDVTFGQDGMVGTLCNDPDWVRGLSFGDRITFTLDRVSDWFFLRSGVLHGGLTLKLLYRHYTREQFAECRRDPPACYLADWYEGQRSERS